MFQYRFDFAISDARTHTQMFSDTRGNLRARIQRHLAGASCNNHIKIKPIPVNVPQSHCKYKLMTHACAPATYWSQLRHTKSEIGMKVTSCPTYATGSRTANDKSIIQQRCGRNFTLIQARKYHCVSIGLEWIHMAKRIKDYHKCGYT